MKRRALITGITGQDGAYLSRLLLSMNYEVAGTYRRLSTPNFWRLQALSVYDKVTLFQADMNDTISLLQAVSSFEPHEVYHLAAQSFVDASFKEPLATGEVTGLGTTRLLEVIRHSSPNTKFYNAATSELYGDGLIGTANEETRFRPSSPYAAAKLYSYHVTRLYREAYGLFTVSGILFNHESPLRGLEFVTRKVTDAAARIKLGLQEELSLGNLSAKRDWGYAPEYMEAAVLMMKRREPDDFVIATGEAHSVEELCEAAFSYLGLDWRRFVRVEEKFLRPQDVEYLQGDYSKAREELSWSPNVHFEALIKLMVNEDLNRWKRHLEGKMFPWDAANYVQEVVSVK